MAELAPVERLQPFLLDRLTDDEPERQMESRERRVMSPRDFRAALLRDLGWLLNAGAHPPSDGLDQYPEVSKSVLNYGLPSLSGQTASSIKPEQIERLVRNAIFAFEPRVLRQSFHVSAVEAGDGRGHAAPYVVQLELRGEVWNMPMPESLYVRTEVDLDTGHCKLADEPQLSSRSS
jgi:type VI secretion system protein ImpF